MKNIFLLIVLTFCSLSIMKAQGSIEDQLIVISYSMALEGFELTHDVTYNKLPEEESNVYGLKLQKGVSYRVTTICDYGCRDIDLRIYDGDHNQIDIDIEKDAYPIVSVKPKWTEEFYLNVKMCKCLISPCRFGIAIFGKQ